MTATVPISPVLAAADQLKNFLPLLYVLAALVVGVIVIMLANRWRKKGGDFTISASDQLAQYRALYEQGVISQEEYNKLRSLLGGEIRKGLDLPSPAPPAPAVRSDQVTPQTPPADEPPPTGIRPT